MANIEYDDHRQLKCQRKFDKMVDQFDELIQVMDAVTRPPKSKRQRVNPTPKRSNKSKDEGEGQKSTSNWAAAEAGTSSAATTTAGNSEATMAEDRNGALVKLITRHLDDLNTQDGDQLC